MEWLFDILSEFEKRSNLHDYSIEGRRTPGHLGERLLTLYYLHLKRTRQIKIKSLQNSYPVSYRACIAGKCISSVREK